MGYEIVQPPTVEPVSLELARHHLRIDAEGSPPESPDDFWLTHVGIPAARAAAEAFTGRAFARQRVTWLLDEFPGGAIELGMPPLIEIVSVEYADASGAMVAIPPTGYAVDRGLSVPWLAPAYGSGWPQAAAAMNAVRITFDCGYAPEAVPPNALAAMLLMLGHLYRNREAVGDARHELPLGFESLLRPLQVRLGVA